MTTVDLADFVHVPEISAYNLNYYKNKHANTDVLIKVHSDEQYDTVNLYLVRYGNEIFFGSCNYSPNDIYEINIGEMYT